MLETNSTRLNQFEQLRSFRLVQTDKTSLSSQVLHFSIHFFIEKVAILSSKRLQFLQKMQFSMFLLPISNSSLKHKMEVVTNIILPIRAHIKHPIPKLEKAF